MASHGIGLSFLADLQSGFLSDFLAFVKNDHTLDLQIRGDYINIYYRGGNIIRISVNNGGGYAVFFDTKYCSNSANKPNNRVFDVIKKLPKTLGPKAANGVSQWVDAIPYLKQAMDFFFASHKKNEREFQQLIVRENNYVHKVTARSSDYYICDIEYEDSTGKKTFRPDMVAIKWESDPQARKDTGKARLGFIEVKYGDGSLSGKSGIIKHIDDMKDYLSTPSNLNNLQNEIKDCFNQKVDLGLVDVGKKLTGFDTMKPEYIFVLINHDPSKTPLHGIIQDISTKDYKNYPFELKFAVSNFMGYALFKEGIFTFDQFVSRFSQQIG